MAPVHRCAARLRDGQPCGRTVADGSEFCVHHGKLAASNGAEVIKQGLPRATRDHRVTFECGDCGKRKRVEIPVADVRARVAGRRSWPTTD